MNCSEAGILFICLLYQQHCRYCCFLTKTMSEFRNANFGYVPLMIPAVQPAASVARAICLLFVSPRQMEFLSTKKGKLLPGQRWLRAKRGLNNPRMWRLWKQISACMQEVSFFYWMPWAHCWSWHLIKIRVYPAVVGCCAIISPIQSVCLLVSEDPWASGLCFCYCWALQNRIATSLSRLSEDLCIRSFTESQKCTFIKQSTQH